MKWHSSAIGGCVWLTFAFTLSVNSKGDIPLRYPGRRPGVRPGRRPVASWNFAYQALSSSLAAS